VDFTRQNWDQVTASWVGKSPGYVGGDWDAVTAQWPFRPDSPSVSAGGVLSGEPGASMRLQIADQVLSGSWALSGYSDAMALAPSTVWPGYSSDGTSITFALADLDNLTATEAASDWREVLQSILLSVSNHLEPLPHVDRPRTLALNVYNDWNYPHPSLGWVIRREVWFRIHIDFATRRVADEP
jgi:hypothetical protein